MEINQHSLTNPQDRVDLFFLKRLKTVSNLQNNARKDLRNRISYAIYKVITCKEIRTDNELANRLCYCLANKGGHFKHLQPA